MELKKSDFYYDLPEELIAQYPLENRSSSRLMILDKTTGKTKHSQFTDVINYLNPGDCLVINNTKVIPARLIGERIVEDIPLKPGFARPKEGAVVEVLLLKRIDKDSWECIVRPGKKLRTGAYISFGDGRLRGRITDVHDDGNRIISFEYTGIFEELLDSLGTMPLPPYITHELKDKNRYQTVYAKHEGSAAAPTAGLHFTKELLEEIRSKGIVIAEVTLHVGLGTFRPVKEDNVLDHHMHSEYYEVLPEEADKINTARSTGHKIICVGTTSCRTVESASTPDGVIHPGCGNTEIFIYPGYKFKCLDYLITNFHLPESTLIMLVSALAGRENVLNAYNEAVLEKYRFFSFGDAMFITDL